MKRQLAIVILLEVTLLLGVAVAPLRSQSAAGQTPTPQSTTSKSTTATGSPLAFDIASVKPNKSDDGANSNFPLGPGDVYVPNGGFFSATNFPLVTYIFFAYRIMSNQQQYLLPQLPEWTTADRFDIQARAEGNPGKDQMRMMMRSLLADRFKLTIHYETRQVPVLAMVLAKPGKMGPQLRPHPSDSSCPTTSAPASASASESASAPSPDQTVAGGFPALCNGIFGMPPSAPGRVRFAARNVTLAFIADALGSWADVGRPMVDQTGLSGKFDFIIEFTPENKGPRPSGVDSQPDTSSDTSGPAFQEALKQQLGIKLESRKGPVDVIVLDHVEHPTEN